MKLIKLVLDEVYDTISARDNSAKDDLIREAIENLSDEYHNLTSSTSSPIDYSDPVKRFAYIYKYTVAHADYTMQLIESCQPLRELFAKKSIEVACLGGGPGSDLLGILKFLLQQKTDIQSLKCYIFDKERAWGDSWSDVASHLRPAFHFYPVFQQMDVTSPDTWRSYQKFLRADIFTLIYFLSEVYKIKDAAEKFFGHCMSKMTSGSMMLIVDNNDSRFMDWFDGLARSHELIEITASTGDLCFSNDEEKTDLEPYLSRFKWPKRKSNAFWRIMRKP